ncbi:hypothetical protein [Pyrobaculum islandicum]|uniref:hypothetical protein n=1 Tax=Pyrobaculum islandicum TaxID=2277 RepID=UPI0014333C4A|nr:hypothetical protein [Pyrobaculum islandicum]
MSEILRRLLRRGAYNIFEKLLGIEREKHGLRYVPADAVGYAVVCPRYAAMYAAEREVAVFARALIDRVRYAEELKIVDPSVLKSTIRKALRGDRKAAESLLEVGRGLTPKDIERIFPSLRQEFERYRKAARGPPPEGFGEETYYFYNYAEPLPYAGFSDIWGSYVVYIVAGIASDYVYVFKYVRGLDYSIARSMAAAEGDVAAKIWQRPRVKIHIQKPEKTPKITYVDPHDPEPHYKAFQRGEPRAGPLCHRCPYKDLCTL